MFMGCDLSVYSTAAARIIIAFFIMYQFTSLIKHVNILYAWANRLTGFSTFTVHIPVTYQYSCFLYVYIIVNNRLTKAYSSYSLIFLRMKNFEVFYLALKLLLSNILALQRHLIKLISSLAFKVMTPSVINILSVHYLWFAKPVKFLSQKFLFKGKITQPWNF